MNSLHPQHLVRPAKSRHRTAKALLAIVVASGLLMGIPGRSSSATEHNDKDAQLVIDITKGLLQISDIVVQNLSRFLPASETATVIQVHRHLAQLMAELDTEPATVLSAKQDDHLESILARYGPGDPFASLPIVSVATLKPGDLLVRCSSAFSSQMTEMMIWSRYTHVALYIGTGKIIDSTWQHGVKTRPLADLLHESNRVGVLRIEGLISAQEQALVSAAQSKEGSEYNFPAVKTLGTQKLAALTNVPQESPAGMIDILSRAEQLPPDTVDNGRFACSQLVAFALKAVNITLSHANGLTPGDMVRLGQTGLLTKVGRLKVPSSSPTDANHSDTN